MKRPAAEAKVLRTNGSRGHHRGGLWGNQARYVVGPALTTVDDPDIADWSDTQETP
jgi:hypothetical protein